MERFAPSHVGKGGFARAMRLTGFLGLAGGFLYFYQRSIRTYILYVSWVLPFSLGEIILAAEGVCNETNR
jgi:hypothetical protein